MYLRIDLYGVIGKSGKSKILNKTHQTKEIKQISIVLCSILYDE